jgi:hypothetical protein
MVDTIQIVLLLVIVVLAVVLLILGIQAFLILKDFRKTVKKVNKVLDDTNSITRSVQQPLSALSSLAMGIKGGTLLTFVKLIRTFVEKESDDEKKHA